MDFIVLLTLITVISMVVCNLIAKKRGSNPVFWTVMGALFGPLAIPFVFLSKKQVQD